MKPAEKQQWHVKQTKDIDQTVVEGIFTSAAARFGLANTKLASLIQGTICNYSEGLGWGFGLGALRIDDLICVGLNPAKASAERCRPVFDYISNELVRAFGDRVVLATKEQEINPATLPRVPVSDEHRVFVRKLFEREPITMFIPLLDENIDVWRPVSAVRTSDNIFRILGNPAEGEHWKFINGDLVRCKQRTFADGTSGLVGYEKVVA
jgi:hypothetical protein